MEYKELTELLAFVKSEEKFLLRMEELKQQEMQLAHVRSIAATIEQADMLMADAKARAANLVLAGQEEAAELVAKCEVLKKELNTELAKNKEKQKDLKEARASVEHATEQLAQNKLNFEKEIKQHRESSAKLQKDIEDTWALRKKLEDKFVALKQLMLA